MADKTQERSTIEYELKSKNHVVVLKEYLTGREKRAIKNALWHGKKMQIRDGKGESDPVPMDEIDASTDKTIELMVVSLDGSSEKVLDSVLDMRDADYDDLLEKIEELTGSISEEKKDAGQKNTQSK